MINSNFVNKGYLILISIFFSIAVNGQDSIMKILNQVFPAYELNSDLAFIKNKAENKRYGGNGFLYGDKERFYKLYDSIEKVIDDKKEMSRLDFYLLTAPLIRCIQDDQSYYSLMGDYTYDKTMKRYHSFSDKTILPFDVDVFNDTAFIFNDTTEMNRSTIISINNIPASDIILKILRYSSFSKYNYYKKYQTGYFNLYRDPIITKVLFGFKNEVEIKYIPIGSDSIKIKRMDLLPMGDSSFYRNVEQRIASKEWYRLAFKNNYAIFQIRSLPELGMNLLVINDIFKRINKIKPKNLIIDISGCNWSFDSFWIVLLNYLYEGKLSLYEYQGEQQDLEKSTKKFISKKEYIDGDYSDIDPKLKFSGNIYLIVGTSTYSAAVRFADIMRYNKIAAKIFGQETLTRATQYDYPVKHYLPVTKLYLQLSAVLSYALDQNHDNKGFLPDVEIKPETAKEFQEDIYRLLVTEKVIKYIESENLK
jgi:hypothetical protein